LDDSANRRIAIPEAFLTADAILVLLENVFSGLVVHADVARRRLEAEIPFLATENILMEAVRRGGDRQELHEKLRVFARAAAERPAGTGRATDLLDRIAADADFGLTRAELDQAARPERLTGRSSEQVETFVREELDPALAGVEAVASVPLKV
ncbi:MAG TPA: adenylosuccinate lyase, partial [Thermoanaerobaculia bacterium]